jgi:hypothetical protein
MYWWELRRTVYGYFRSRQLEGSFQGQWMHRKIRSIDMSSFNLILSIQMRRMILDFRFLQYFIEGGPLWIFVQDTDTHVHRILTTMTSSI